MKFVQPVVDEATARHRLERQRFKLLRRCVGRCLHLALLPIYLTDRSARREPLRRALPYVEIVWLPSYRVTIETVAKKTVRPVDTLVGGHDGQFALVDLANLTIEHRTDRGHFPPTLDRQQAVDVARSGLVSAILRSAGWGAKPSIGQTHDVELLQYPFWAYYFERSTGLLDVKLLDAVTGKIAGSKVKASLLAALLDAKRSGSGSSGT